MKYVRNNRLTDPFKVWKELRNERYARYKPVAWAVVALSLGLFAWVVRRVRSLWVVGCLGQLFVILLSQLTCYYYSFLLLTAPLTRARRQLEVPLLVFAALTQLVWLSCYWNDDKYTALTALSLAFCYGVLLFFWRPGPRWARWLGLAPRPRQA